MALKAVKKPAADAIQWADPPVASYRTRTSVWIARLAPLMQQPRRWALIKEGAAGSVGTLVVRLRHVGLSGRWEFTTRKAAGAQRALYGRYMGE